jgi:DnaJ-class molecular chaperone
MLGKAMPSTKYCTNLLIMNPYTQLDIPVDASLEEIKQRYRTLAHLHHPDKGGDEEVFKSIKLAYEILIDPIRRKQYDLTGDAEVANIRDEAVTNVVQIILSIIPTFDPDHDDLIDIAKHKTKDMLTKENNQIANIQRDINNFEKVLTKLRIKNNSENILHNVIVNQIRDLRKDLLQNQQNVQACTLMLEILNDYEYGSQYLSFDILPDKD